MVRWNESHSVEPDLVCGMPYLLLFGDHFPGELSIVVCRLNAEAQRSQCQNLVDVLRIELCVYSTCYSKRLSSSPGGEIWKCQRKECAEECQDGILGAIWKGRDSALDVFE